MQVEISIRKEDVLPNGAEAALKEELEKRLFCHFADVRVRAGAAALTTSPCWAA